MEPDRIKIHKKRKEQLLYFMHSSQYVIHNRPGLSRSTLCTLNNRHNVVKSDKQPIFHVIYIFYTNGVY
jgi:hypothetical protein